MTTANLQKIIIQLDWLLSNYAKNYYKMYDVKLHNYTTKNKCATLTKTKNVMWWSIEMRLLCDN